MAEEVWRTYLTTGTHPIESRLRRLFGILPTNPRCKTCYAPFQGIGAPFMRMFFGKRPSKMNPRLCNACEEFANKFQGGAEIELSLLFADVRGSTPLAESMSASEFSKLINRFYKEVTDVLVRRDVLIDKLIGDQVTGMFVPGFAGEEHARSAVEAAQEILSVTGHGDRDGPWIPLGAGVHTGVAYVGSVGSKEGLTDITVLGDVANTGARLSSKARTGEILISEATYAAAELNFGDLEKRDLDLKGKSEKVKVHVLKP